VGIFTRQSVHRLLAYALIHRDNPVTDICPFRLLANHLRREKESLVARWMKIVSGDTDVGKSDTLSRMQLADHLPAIFEEICAALEHQDLDVAQVAVEGDAREHGQWRWRQGYRLDELVRELDLFRQVLTDAVEAYAATDDQFRVSDQRRARYVVDEVISYVTLGSIREVLRERDNKIDEYTGQLERANDELRRSKRRTDKLYEMGLQVTRRVTHDLRNFLNIFSNALQLAEKVPSKMTTALALANRQVSDMKLLTDEMVDYAGVLSSRDAGALETFEVRELYDELVAAIQPAVEEKGLKFNTAFDPFLSATTSNRLKIKQIALNLLGNAAKYTATGEVGFFMKAVGEHHFRIRVTDTGIGICEEDKDRVFEEFERAAGDDFPGTGLGLAIVRELVASLGGEIDFRSHEGAGCVFEVLLPLVVHSER
jgi:signal transduction histidine kinase